ncbi:hypothetical protein [Nocardioides iriomotensis]|uniref:Uncharacterized protein n=1 Tax=Nocardioides iriomotensis TaxID=715784 RepID=A0A4Q5IV75_9ACTN|nr:hypothetical protein [Nocardioides iriomotensis]RYU09824.1 hypothetical protein ETU37_18425 [Nocardioides iriomotensis]
MTWYKFLSAGAVGPFSGYPWPPPGDSHGAGEWITARDGLEPCQSGLHLCRPADLPFWLHEELYIVDVDGPVTEYESFVLAHRARLVHRVPWDQRAARRFSRACAWRVRDLAADALERTGRHDEARELLACTSLDDLDRTVGGLATEETGSAADATGYVADALTFAGGVEGSTGWASATATTALVAAAAARATAPGGSGRGSWAAERQRQASWIAELADR